MESQDIGCKLHVISALILVLPIAVLCIWEHSWPMAIMGKFLSCHMQLVISPATILSVLHAFLRDKLHFISCSLIFYCHKWHFTFSFLTSYLSNLSKVFSVNPSFPPYTHMNLVATSSSKKIH